MPYNIGDSAPADFPSDWSAGDDPDFRVETHCCNWQYWLDRFGGNAELAGWARWITCGPLGYNITCPGEGGTDEA